MHAVLPYTQLCLMEALEFCAMDMTAGLVSKSAERAALGHLR